MVAISKVIEDAAGYEGWVGPGTRGTNGLFLERYNAGKTTLTILVSRLPRSKEEEDTMRQAVLDRSEGEINPARFEQVIFQAMPSPEEA